MEHFLQFYYANSSIYHKVYLAARRSFLHNVAAHREIMRQGADAF